jgi:predicted PurR-regulated permease PerM
VFGQILEDRAFRTGLRGSLAVLLLAAGVLLLWRAWSVIEPLLISVVLAAALWPWVSKLSSVPIAGWRLPRPMVAGPIFLGTLAATGLLIWVTLLELLPHVERLLETYPVQTASVREYLEPFRTGDLLEGARQVAEDVAKQAAQAETEREPPMAPAGLRPIDTGSLVLAAFGGLLTVGLVLVFTFFLLVDGDRYAQWLLLLLPTAQHEHVRAVAEEIRDRLARWVLAEVLYAAVSGLLVGCGIWILQLPSPWLYGVAGAVLAALPGLGPALVAVPATLVAAGMSTWQTVGAVLVGGVIYVADATLIGPKILGKLLRLPTFVVLLAVFLGVALMGAWGALIAAPIAAAAHSILTDQLARPGNARLSSVSADGAGVPEEKALSRHADDARATETRRRPSSVGRPVAAATRRKQ